MSSHQYKYKAFISYSHQDAKWGDWLHKALESYTVPKAVRGKPNRDGKVPDKLFPVFRDREELPTATDLGAVISNAIQESAYLIVICSPRSAKSMWVNQEIISFKALDRENRVLAIIVDGEPNGTDKAGMEEIECFPEALKFVVGDDGELSKERTEPIAADAREGKDGKKNALIKLISGLLGVNYDDLKQREKTRQRNRRITYFVATILLATVGGGYWQYAQKIENQKLVAESESFAIKSEEALKQGDSKRAISLALKGLPEDLNAAGRPWVESVENALSRAMYQHKEHYSFQAHQGKATHVLSSPDGRYLFTAGDDRKIKKWDVNNQQLVEQFDDHNAPILNLSYHPTLPILVSWDVDGHVIIRDLGNQRVLAKFDQYGSEYDKNIYWNDNGQLVFIGKMAWSLKSKLKVSSDFSITANQYENKVYLPVKGSADIAIVESGNITLVDLENRKEIASMSIAESIEKYPGDIATIALVNQNKYYLAIYQSGGAYLFDAKTYQLIKKLPQPIKIHLDSNWQGGKVLHFSNYEFRLWDPQTGDDRALNKDAETIIVSKGVSLIEGHPTLAMIKHDDKIQLFDLKQGQVINTFNSGKKQDSSTSIYNQIELIQSASYDANNNLLNMALIDGRIRAFSLADLDKYLSVDLNSPIKKLITSKDRRFHAAYLTSGELKLIDSQNKKIYTVSKNIDLRAFSFAGAGEQLVVISGNKVYLYSTNQLISSAESMTAVTMLPFDIEVSLKAKLLLSKSGNKMGVVSDYEQLAVYDFNLKQWSKMSRSSGLQNIDTLAEHWLVNSTDLKLTRFDNKLNKLNESILQDKQFYPFYPDTFKFDQAMTHSIWLDKNGQIEYRNLKDNKLIVSIALGLGNSLFTDLSETGDLALIGNHKEMLLIKEKAINQSVRLTPRFGDSASFLVGTFNSKSTQLTIAESIYNEQGSEQAVIYQLEPSNKKQPKILWQSEIFEGNFSLLDQSRESLLFKSDNELILFNRADKSIKHISNMQENLISSITQVSPNGKQFVTYMNGFLSLYDIDSNQPIWQKEIYSQSVLLFSNNGDYLTNVIDLDNSGSIEILDSKTGDIVATNQLHKGVVYGFDSKDKIISWQNSNALCLWDWHSVPTIGYGDDFNKKTQCTQQLNNNGLLFSTDTQYLVVNSVNQYRYIEPDMNKQLGQFSCDISFLIFPVKANSESATCIKQADGIQFFDMNKARVEWPFSSEDKVTNFAQSINGRYLIGSNKAGNIHYVDIKNPVTKLEQSDIILNSQKIARYQIDDSGRYMSLIKTNWLAELWDLKNKKKLHTIQLPKNELNYLGPMTLFVSDKQQSVLIFQSGDIYLWDPINKLSNFKVAPIGHSSPVKINLQNKRLVQVNYDGVHLWDWSSGKKINSHSLKGYVNNGDAIVFHPTLNQFSIKADELTFFDFDDGAKAHVFSLAVKGQEYLSSNSRLVFSSSKDKLAIMFGSNDIQARLEIWDLAQLKKVSELKVIDRKSKFLFSKDSKYLWLVTDKGVTTKWNLTNEKAELIALNKLKIKQTDDSLVQDWLVDYYANWQSGGIELQSPQTGDTVDYLNLRAGDSGAVSNKDGIFKISNNGQYLVAHSSGYGIHIYDTTQRKIIHKIESELGNLVGFEITQDNEQLVTLSLNGSIQYWSIKSGALVRQLDDPQKIPENNPQMGLSISPESDVLTFIGNQVSLWDRNRQGVLGNITIKNSILLAHIDGINRTAMTIEENGVVSFLPLQPKGQALIDKARVLVGGE